MRASSSGWCRRVLVGVLGAGGLLVAGGCQPQQTGVNTELVQTLTDLGDAVSSLQVQSAEMQEQLDSLRLLVARQDTLLRRLAEITPVPSP